MFGFGRVNVVYFPIKEVDKRLHPGYIIGREVSSIIACLYIEEHLSRVIYQEASGIALLCGSPIKVPDESRFVIQ